MPFDFATVTMRPHLPSSDTWNDAPINVRKAGRRDTRGRISSALAGVAAVVISAAAAVTLGSAPAHAAAATQKKVAKCDGSQGWTAAAGRPSALAAGAPAGLYVWNVKGLWYVAATGPNRTQRLFQGSITFDAPLTAKPAGAEGKSDVVSAGANAVAFTFRNFGRIDSAVINAPCATTVSLTGTLDGSPLTPAQIVFGSAATPATALPATLKRDTSSASVVAAAPAAGELTGACPASTWPANTAGRPGGLRKRAGAVHLWNEKASGAWQLLSIADPGRPILVEGKISSNAPVVVQPIGLERADAVRVEGTTIVFSFRTNRAGDGFQFFAPCASQLSFDVAIDGSVIAGSDLLVGSSSEPAPGLPLVISR